MRFQLLHENKIRAVERPGFDRDLRETAMIAF